MSNEKKLSIVNSFVSKKGWVLFHSLDKQQVVIYDYAEFHLHSLDDAYCCYSNKHKGCTDE